MSLIYASIDFTQASGSQQEIKYVLPLRILISTALPKLTTYPIRLVLMPIRHPNPKNSLNLGV